jgi:3-deoxy-D-manno-octulosonic acid kinase
MAYIQQKSVKPHIMLFDSGHFPVPVPKMFTGQYWKTQNAITGQATGRGTTYFFKHDKNEYVLRHYRRGGLIGKVLSDQYMYTGIEKSRAWREFKLLQQMKKYGFKLSNPDRSDVEEDWLILPSRYYFKKNFQR